MTKRISTTDVRNLSSSSKTKTCTIAGCENPSKRSFSSERIGPSLTSSGLKVKDSRKRKTYLCQDHWKKVKKEFKKDTKPERMRWGH
ncbi:MAG: hypothetical protein ACTSU3_09185 [Candidatus Thorarchaeota archaeon]